MKRQVFHFTRPNPPTVRLSKETITFEDGTELPGLKVFPDPNPWQLWTELGISQSVMRSRFFEWVDMVPEACKNAVAFSEYCSLVDLDEREEKEALLRAHRDGKLPQFITSQDGPPEPEERLVRVAAIHYEVFLATGREPYQREVTRLYRAKYGSLQSLQIERALRQLGLKLRKTRQS